MRTASKLMTAACVGAIAVAAPAADWPQWRGSDRSGVSPEKGLLKTWPEGGPNLLWTYKNAGSGYSGPAVVEGNVYLMGNRDGTEYLFSLDAKGSERWAAKIGPLFDFKGNQWSGGPNATPSVEGGLVYGLGSQGILVCVDAKDGKEVWRKDLPSEMDAEVNPVGGGPEKMGWGFSWSPLVDGDQLVITPGGPKGLLAALDKKTGKQLWRSDKVAEQATYSAPIPMVVDGVRQYVQMTQNSVVGIDAKNGDLLWTYTPTNPFPDVVCVTPVVSGNRFYITAWQAKAEVLEVTRAGGKWGVNVVWSKKEISNVQGGVVLVDKFVYGYHADRAWECQEFATGKVKWSARGGPAAGSLMAADGLLFCLSQKEEKGDVALVSASPEKFEIHGRFELPEGSKLRKTRGGVWTPPAISDGKLYLRDQELVFCYEVK
jgi:outer membrane protein assembly factor BamB